MQSQSPPFSILALSNNHSGLATKSRAKTQQQQQQQQSGGQLTPIPVTNPTLRASHDGGQRKGADEDKGKCNKGKSTYTGDKAPRYMYDADELANQSMHDEQADADSDPTLPRDEQGTIQSAEESEGEEGQVVAAPATKKRRAGNPYRPGCCGTVLYASARHKFPKDLPQGTTLIIKEWIPRITKKKDTQETFKTFDLVDVNGGLWYGVAMFNYWREQVEKGALPEPDMVNNNIGLYKDHEDNFQVTIVPKPKPKTKKK